jgi:hypothetical protein
MITGTSRGWSIVFENDCWLWSDNKEPITIERPCKRCGRIPTKEGYDACMGFVNGATSACCGHGVSEKIIVMNV